MRQINSPRVCVCLYTVKIWERNISYEAIKDDKLRTVALKKWNWEIERTQESNGEDKNPKLVVYFPSPHSSNRGRRRRIFLRFIISLAIVYNVNTLTHSHTNIIKSYRDHTEHARTSSWLARSVPVSNTQPKTAPQQQQQTATWKENKRIGSTWRLSFKFQFLSLNATAFETDVFIYLFRFFSFSVVPHSSCGLFFSVHFVHSRLMWSL